MQPQDNDKSQDSIKIQALNLSTLLPNFFEYTNTVVFFFLLDNRIITHADL